jgi:hypothetical protein
VARTEVAEGREGAANDVTSDTFDEQLVVHLDHDWSKGSITAGLRRLRRRERLFNARDPVVSLRSTTG